MAKSWPDSWWCRSRTYDEPSTSRSRQLGAGDHRGVHPAGHALLVEPVEDLVDQVGADALVEAPLLPQQVVASGLGQTLEVGGVLRRGHLEGELRVLHREEPRRPGHPVQRLPGSQRVEQVGVHLGSALSAAHDGDRPQLAQGVPVLAGSRRCAMQHRVGRTHRPRAPRAAVAPPQGRWGHCPRRGRDGARGTHHLCWCARRRSCRRARSTRHTARTAGCAGVGRPTGSSRCTPGAVGRTTRGCRRSTAGRCPSGS